MARQLASSLETKLGARSVFGVDLIELHLSTSLYFTSSNIDIRNESIYVP